ncbi:MAG: acetyl-CoA carboxylase biotin carboxyl carrier protein subunit, partial [Actinobacteria bacterium]|nr:acetyl-CoA carboxylase biotin carboxyl carrier protein subunit [Actinomycetota bacterium]
LKVLVAVGEAVEPGQALVVIEAMKMETAVASRSAGVVAAVEVVPGQAVAAGRPLVVLE